MRRDQFRYCLKILQHFRTLETYFKIYHKRNKGQTIKTNVIRSIIKSGKEQLYTQLNSSLTIAVFNSHSKGCVRRV
jgi:hypothetical protein